MTSYHPGECVDYILTVREVFCNACMMKLLTTLPRKENQGKINNVLPSPPSFSLPPSLFAPPPLWHFIKSTETMHVTLGPPS